MAGRLHMVPSIEYKPSTIRRIFFHGRCVRGWPCEMTSRRRFSSDFMLLCLNMRTLAPENRTPTRIDAWLSSSEMTRQPLPTTAGITVELVAKPMDTIVASSWPTNLATSASAWR
jgi:hypothetical protein